MKTISQLIFCCTVSLIFLNCSKESGSKFQNDFHQPVYPDLDLEEISSDTPSELAWLSSSRFHEIDYLGKRPLFFVYNSNNNLICLDDNSGAIKWVSQLTTAPYVLTNLAIYDYKEHLIVFAGRNCFILNAETGQVLEGLKPGDYLSGGTVNGFSCVEDKIYVLTSLPTDNSILIELFEFDLDQKIGHKLYERSRISGMERSEFIMPTDEGGNYLFFAREIKQDTIGGSYIFKINRHTGEETLFFCGSTNEERPISDQNLFYINDKFMYLTSSRFLVYSFTENRSIGKTVGDNTFFHGNYYFTWSQTRAFKAFTLENLKPVWSEIYLSHSSSLNSQPATHPDQTIICVPTRTGVNMIDIASGRMLFIINTDNSNEEPAGVRINNNGTVLYVFTNVGRITAYKWPF